YQIHGASTQSVPGSTTAEALSNSFNITASKLVVLPVTTPVRVAAPFAVTVEARGADEFVDPNFTGPVTLAIKTFTPTGATVPTLTTAPNPKNAVAGVVTFSSASLNLPGVYTLSATSGELTGVSNSIQVLSNLKISQKVTPVAIYQGSAFTYSISVSNLDNL